MHRLHDTPDTNIIKQARNKSLVYYILINSLLLNSRYLMQQEHLLFDQIYNTSKNSIVFYETNDMLFN